MQGDSDRDLRTGFLIFIIVVFLLDKKSGEFLFYVGSFLTGYSCVKLRYLYGYKERRGEFMMYVVLLCSGIYVLVQAIISV